MGVYELRYRRNTADIKSRVALPGHMENTTAECGGVTGLKMVYREQE